MYTEYCEFPREAKILSRESILLTRAAAGVLMHPRAHIQIHWRSIR